MQEDTPQEGDAQEGTTQEDAAEEGTAQEDVAQQGGAQEGGAPKSVVPQIHDRAYKVLLGSKEIVWQFLLECGPYAGIPAYVFDPLDPNTLELIDPVIVKGGTYAERVCDRLWRIEYIATLNGVPRRRCLYVYVPLEFQSTIDPDMAFRFDQFVQMAKEAARSRDEYLPDDEPPLMLPFVIYCGDTPWEGGLGKREPGNFIAIEKALSGGLFALLDMQRYALEEAGRHDLISKWARLERASEGSSMAWTMVEIYAWIERNVSGDARKRELREAFHQRGTELGVLWDEDGSKELSFDDLEKLYNGGTMQEVVESNYQKRMRQLCDEAREETRQELESNYQKRMRQLCDEAREETRQELESNYQKRMRQLCDEASEKSLEIGREEGREEGLMHQRNMLHRIAAVQFDADTASQLAVLLERIDDPNHLEDITDWTVNGYTKAEFLHRVEGLIP